jgi:sporulation protein YlmC with PRC-barrel domain
MRTIPIAAAVLALLSTAALAQSRSPATMPSAGTAPAPMQRAPAVNPLTQSDVSTIEGAPVYGSDNKSIGKVSDLLMDPKTKKIDRLVVAEGGVLGIGSHHVAIPVDKFSWDSSKGAFTISQTLASIKAMPEWSKGATATATGSSEPPRPGGSPTGAGR